MRSRRRLWRENEWSRVYEENGVFQLESKFLTEDRQVDSTEIKRRWAGWSETERLSFAQAFQVKPTLTEHDEEIIAFLLSQGGSDIWVTISPLLPYSSNRKAAIEFLTSRLKARSESLGNYCQALEQMGAKEALPALKAAYQQARADRRAGAAEIDYYFLCKALAELDGAGEYIKELRALRDSQNDAVRRLARAQDRS